MAFRFCLNFKMEQKQNKILKKCYDLSERNAMGRKKKNKKPKMCDARAKDTVEKHKLRIASCELLVFFPSKQSK